MHRMTHTGSDGSDAGQRISREGYRWSAWGENVAVGYPHAAGRGAGLDAQPRPPRQHPQPPLPAHRRRRAGAPATARSTGPWTSPGPADARLPSPPRTPSVGSVPCVRCAGLEPERAVRPGPAGPNGVGRRLVARDHPAPVGLGRPAHASPRPGSPAPSTAPRPFRLGRLAVLDIATARTGERLRPVTLRLNPTASPRGCGRWRTSPVPGRSLAWFVAVNRLAAATVAAGQLTPVVASERGLRLARWRPVTDAHPRRRLCRARRGRAADLPAPDDPSDRRRHPRRARRRLARRPPRRPALASRPGARPARRRRRPARAVFRALADADPIVRGRTAPPTSRRSTRSPPRSIATIAARSVSPSSCPGCGSSCPRTRSTTGRSRIELVDELDPGRWCSADDVWDATPLAVELAGLDGPPRRAGARLVDTASAGRRASSTRSAELAAATSRRRSSSTWRPPTGSSSRRRPSSTDSASS